MGDDAAGIGLGLLTRLCSVGVGATDGWGCNDECASSCKSRLSRVGVSGGVGMGVSEGVVRTGVGGSLGGRMGRNDIFARGWTRLPLSMGAMVGELRGDGSFELYGVGARRGALAGRMGHSSMGTPLRRRLGLGL